RSSSRSPTRKSSRRSEAMDLELLLRVARPRNIAVLVLGAAVAKLAYDHQEIPRRWVSSRLYPPVSAAPDLSISTELETRKARHIEAKYRRLCGLIEEARATGFSVDGLQAKADAAYALNKPGYRDA